MIFPRRARWLLLTILAAPAFGQEPAQLLVEPRELTLEVGEKATLTAIVNDNEGKPISANVIFYSRARDRVTVNPLGIVEAFTPGKHVVVAMVPKFQDEADEHARTRFAYDEELLKIEIPVTVPSPPVASVSFDGAPRKLYAGSTVAIELEVVDRSGAERKDVPVSFESLSPDVAFVDETGQVSGRKEGRATLVARAEGIEGRHDLEVAADPVASIELTSSAESGRTGDVIHFRAVARDRSGNPISDYPIQLATFSHPGESIIAPGATAFIEEDGAFVAERPGLHTVVAIAGRQSAQKTVSINPRNVRKEVKVVGQGPVRDRHTSDLWVWEAPNGRDYAITGTWGADGHANFWDVTNPSNIQLVDTVKVDARTVNDVKISEDGRLAVISREGASNRRNGLVLLDVSDPTDGVRVLSRYDDQLVGGVHNVFIAGQHVYALSNGRRYDIVNVEDPTKPYRVGRFELTTPGHGVHDVWVVDGVAFSSNWQDGVVAVDVGGGGKGGAPNKPVMLGSYAYPSGWNHAAFPYRSQSTGKTYVFVGDEAFPYSFEPEGKTPIRAAGWIHIVEWDDWNAPREVARYQVPEAGTHNLWVEDDILYVAYYNGGLRVVDVSGELRGDLYKQGREIAFFHPYDPEGFIRNAPFVWGPQPYKGHIFLTDHNSGLWAVKLVDPEKPLDLGEPH